jgi:hypothetical protein
MKNQKTKLIEWLVGQDCGLVNFILENIPLETVDQRELIELQTSKDPNIYKLVREIALRLPKEHIEYVMWIKALSSDNENVVKLVKDLVKTIPENLLNPDELAFICFSEYQAVSDFAKSTMIKIDKSRLSEDHIEMLK